MVNIAAELMLHRVFLVTFDTSEKVWRKIQLRIDAAR